MSARVLVERTRDLLQSLGAIELDSFLGAWPEPGERRPVIATFLPVLRWLPELQIPESVHLRALLAAVRTAASVLAWHQSYEASEVGSDFLNNYGWAEVVGLSGEVPCESLACGFLLLGPNTFYPPHRHEAEEIYIPVSGTARWRKGDAPWCERPPGALIHHAPQEPHSMRTGASALLALYLWRSDRLEQKSQLDPVPCGQA